MYQKWLVRFLTATGLFLLLIFLCRNSILQFAFKRAQQKSLDRYQVALNASSVKFSGMDNVVVQNLTMVPQNADTLLLVRSLSLNLSLLDLLTAKIGFNEISVDTAFINVYNLPQRSNIAFLKNRKRDTTVTANNMGEENFRSKAEGYKSKLLRVFNTAFHASGIHVSYRDSTSAEQLFLPAADYDLENLSAVLINRQNNDVMQLKAKVLSKNASYSFEIYHQGKASPYFPFLNKEDGIRCRFNRLWGNLNFENTGGELVVSTAINADNFLLGHWRLAKEDVVLKHAAFEGKLKVSESKVELDSASSVLINSVKTNLFVAYNKQPQLVFTLQINMPETVSDTFFRSLPQGMFNTLKGISCSGTLQYNLLFSIPAQQPDSLVFTSALKRKNFSIRHYGNENYARINGPFIYEAFDKDRFVRYINVSPENPSFTPLGRINSLLVKSVLQSEDPSFMQHRGFLTEAFRESIIKNYKEKRFARGGSTISMQLVKNVFLSRDKTVSRKAEEALIVYLIENLGLVNKERMLEIYLNVIEWGPNVYGIAEASRFYFNKTPGELSLKESIFLAGIIPAPKYFKYQFDKEGNMRSYMNGYFRILSGRMAYKGLISATDTIGLAADVKLTGPALRLIVPLEDSLQIPLEEPEE